MMWQTAEDDLFMAGEKVSPGVYRQVDSNREICVEKEDVLPASLDGRVACYMRVNNWAQIAAAFAVLN